MFWALGFGLWRTAYGVRRVDARGPNAGTLLLIDNSVFMDRDVPPSRSQSAVGLCKHKRASHSKKEIGDAYPFTIVISASGLHSTAAI